MFSRYFKLTLICLMAVVINGCATTSVPPLETSDVPSAWEQADTAEQDEWPSETWWEQFASLELNQIVNRVEESNLDLQVNQANLEQAQLLLRDAGFELFPTPSVTLGVSESYSGSEPDGQGYSDSSSGSADLSLGLSYNRILSKPTEYTAAKADYNASVANAADVRLNTLSTATSTYFQILLLRDQIQAAHENVANAQTIAKIAETRVEVGVITPLEALQQRIALENQKASLRQLQQSEYAARAALSLMLASSVQGFDVEADSLEQIAVPQVSPGMPSSLLSRRPDLVAAQANLVGSTKQVDLARLEFLPNISLTGSANLVSDSLSSLLDGADLFVDAAASVVQTLLDNGARSRSTKRARLNLEASLANYRKAVISAFNEVEVNLSNLDVLQALGQVASSNRGLAEEAFRLAEVRYREGAVDYQTVLVAQNTLFDARNAYYQNKLSQLNAVVALYVALGGGWQIADAHTHS